MKIYFISNNKFKLEEAVNLLGMDDLEVIPHQLRIDEIQSSDPVKIVKDKVKKAFRQIKRPVFVEHTALCIQEFGDLPGGLTQIMWDSLKANKFCAFFGNGKDYHASAKSIIGYCDGRRIYTFEGVINGRIATKPRGRRSFQWDCVFIPDGYDKTFAEMGEEKNKISMRRIALQKFRDYLEEAKNE